MTTRIRMHSPPKETAVRDKFNNDQIMTLIIVVIVCVTVTACLIGGIYVGTHR